MLSYYNNSEFYEILLVCALQNTQFSSKWEKDAGNFKSKTYLVSKL